MKAMFILLILNLSVIAYSQSSNDSSETCKRESFQNPSEKKQIKKQLEQYLSVIHGKRAELTVLQDALLNQYTYSGNRQAKLAKSLQQGEGIFQLYTTLKGYFENALDGIMPEIDQKFLLALNTSISDARFCALCVSNRNPICLPQERPETMNTLQDSWWKRVIEREYQNSGLDWQEVASRLRTLLSTYIFMRYTATIRAEQRNSIILSERTKSTLLAASFMLTGAHLSFLHFNQKQYYGWFVNIINLPNLLAASILPVVNWYRNRGLLPEPPPALPVWILLAEQREQMLAGLMEKIKEGPGLFKQTACVICAADYEPDEAISNLDCGHDFHTGCLTQWAQTLPQQLCALCRKY